MKRFKWILAFCLTSIVAFPQEATESGILQLSLSEAQHYAVENNRTLKNASLDVLKSKASRWQSIASMLPQISATGDYSKMYDKDFKDYKLELGVMQRVLPPTGTMSVTSAMAISGAQIIAANMSRIAMNLSDISQQQSVQQIRDQVKTMYYSALVMEETIHLLQSNYENMDKLYQFTDASVRVGISEQTDADQLLVQLATMQTGINSSERSLEMVYNSLRLLLGLEADTPLELTDRLKDLINIDSTTSLLSEDFVPDNNYSYQLLKESTKLSKKQVSAAKWNYGPSISTFFQYSRLTHFGEDGGFDMTPPYMVGASVSLPIFSSASRLSAVRSAKFDYEKQLNTLDETEESLRIQHSQLCFNLNSAFETYQTQCQNIEVTQRVFDNISNKYKYGTASSLDLTNAGTNLITAESSYVQAVMDLVNAQIALEELLNIEAGTFKE